MMRDWAERARQRPGGRAARVFALLSALDIAAVALGAAVSYFFGLLYAMWRSGAGVRNLFQWGEGAENAVHLTAYIDSAPCYIFLLILFHVFFDWLIGRFARCKGVGAYPLFFAAVFRAAIMMVAVWFVAWAKQSVWHMRGFFTTIIVMSVPVSVALGAALDALKRRIFESGVLRRVRVALVGGGAATEAARERSARRALGAYEVVHSAPPPPPGADARRFVEKLLADSPGGADAVFIIAPDAPRETVMETVLESALAGKCVKAAFPADAGFTFLFEEIGGARLAHFGSLADAARFDGLREALNRAAAALALAPALLLHLAVSACIRAGSPGAALFRQRRFGLFGSEFTMFKYRTMCDGAESLRAGLAHMNESDGGLFKLKDDMRVTRAGRWLRRSSLDEVPQIINILRGEMLFAGPRPLPCSDMEGYAGRWQAARHLSKPGVTGVWQAGGRSHVGFDDMCVMDIWYSLNRSVRLDVTIAWKTVKSVLFSVGAW